ncbi:LOW QUALITY PROTEIN: hypothetical protein ACHAW6_008759 [Cyclotella cf. meneghiniana]
MRQATTTGRINLQPPVIHKHKPEYLHISISIMTTTNTHPIHLVVKFKHSMIQGHDNHGRRTPKMDTTLA